MNIGIVSQALPYLPSRGGFRLYGGNLIRQLSRRNRVDLVSLLIEDDEAHTDWSKQHCGTVRTIKTGKNTLMMQLANAASAHLWGRPIHHRDELDAMLQAEMDKNKWDVIHIEGAFAGGILNDRLPIAKVLSLHDSWTLRCDEMLKCSQSTREWLYYRFLKFHEPRFERLLFPRFERCTVVAEPDLYEVRRIVPECNVDLIPYGTDTEYFHAVEVEKNPAELVFHSHLGYAPNIGAALEFANDIFPLVQRQCPAATFHLVGAAPDQKIKDLASRPGIKISADLPDLRPAVCSGKIYVCPIRYGTGLKSKMLEAMAMQLPIVGYPGAIVGLEGSRPGEHYLLAQTAAEFADHVVALLKNTNQAQTLAAAGRKLVEEKYSWDSRARDYEQLYARVIDERKGREHCSA